MPNLLVKPDHAGPKGGAAEFVAPQMHPVREEERKDPLPPQFAKLRSPRL